MESHLHWADILILVVFMVISLAIGVYHSLTGGRQKTTAEFIMADRKLKVIPTSLSLVVTIVSSLLLLGITAEIYGYGVQYSLFFILSTTTALIFVERFIVPWLYRLKLVSVFEYFEKRFMSRSMRIFGAAMGIAWAGLFMGVIMYAPSAALESATGLPLAVSIPAMAAVSVAYTALGGMRAVIWTDVFQFVIMVGGMLAIVTKGLVVVGGISNVFRLAGEEGRLIWANFSIDPRERNTVWSCMIGLTIAFTNSFGLSQGAVQRFSAVDKLSKARTTVLLTIPPVFLMEAMAGIIGLVVLAYYSSIKCDPLVNRDIFSPNMLLPHFVVTIFADSPGFAGIFLVTLYGGTLSSVSSCLSGSAANCWEDILKWKLSHLPESRKALINKILVVMFGILSTGVAFLSASLPGPIIQVLMALYSSIIGPLVALFILGAVSRHANWKGAMLGGIVGILITLWLSIGSMTVHHKQPHLTPLSVDQCSIANKNSTLLAYSLNYVNHTRFEEAGGVWNRNSWNETTVFPLHTESGVIKTFQKKSSGFQGIENFYAVSYLWFIPIGMTITLVIGMLASLITRDRELEAKVDERLLMRFHGCGWSDDDEKEEQMEDGNKASLKETKDLKGPEDGFIKDTDFNGDLKRYTDNRLVTKTDPEATSYL